jgi:hypothetical protein
MSREPVVFRFSAARGWGIVAFGLFAGAVGAGFSYFVSHAEKGIELGTLLVSGAFALLVISAGLRLVLDRSPRLTVDGDGIIDHVGPGGERRVAWGEVQGVDWRTKGQQGVFGELILYIGKPGGLITPHTINITDLDGGPAHVGTVVKGLWLQFTGSRGAAG